MVQRGTFRFSAPLLLFLGSVWLSTVATRTTVTTMTAVVAAFQTTEHFQSGMHHRPLTTTTVIFMARDDKQGRQLTKINYRSSVSDNTDNLSISSNEFEWNTINNNNYNHATQKNGTPRRRGRNHHHLHINNLQTPKSSNPADVEFVQRRAPTESDQMNLLDIDPDTKQLHALDTHQQKNTDLSVLESSHYPFAAMMQGSGPYIASHAGKIAVFHVPGDQIEKDHILDDMALCWLLGMKIVIVTAARCLVGESNKCQLEYPHEYHNALKVVDRDTLVQVEEEAGYLRTELERKLNRCLRAHGGSTPANGKAPLEGNVVSGNFYTAQKFKKQRGEDFGYSGSVSEIHTENIKKVLQHNDVVVLTTVGMSHEGELVKVNGYHLAASVASALQASKLIYMANLGCVMVHHNGKKTPIQELPLSFAKSITQFRGVTCHNPGFATFQAAKSKLPAPAVELLLHLGWSAWAVERGVQRAHIVNPGDGALLEELYTSKNGANTCLYHDDEHVGDAAEEDDDEEWEAFFREAAEQGQSMA